VDRDLFTYEADMVATHIAQRQAPAMSWDDTLGNMRLLDRWRQEIGLGLPTGRLIQRRNTVCPTLE
jgi:hypothetical protein